MKALVLKEKKKFEMIEKEIPQIKENQVLIKVKKAGICGSDIHMIWATGYGAGTGHVIGHEFCGVITDAGESQNFQVGDRVVAMEIDPCYQDDCEFCQSGRPQICDHVLDGGPGIGSDGGYGEYVAVREDMVRKIPDTMSDVEGALVEPASISMHAVKLAHVKEGSTVLISGGGTIGLFAAACAYALGAKEVVVLEVNQERIKLAKDSGFVTHVFNSLDENLSQQLKDLCPHGFDAVLECSGNQKASTLALNNLKKGGHMTFVAYGTQPDIEMFQLINNEWHLSGSVFFTPNEFEEVIELIAAKKIDLERYAHIIQMEDVQRVLEDLEAGKENSIKYVIDMDK